MMAQSNSFQSNIRMAMSKLPRVSGTDNSDSLSCRHRSDLGPSALSPSLFNLRATPENKFA